MMKAKPKSSRLCQVSSCLTWVAVPMKSRKLCRKHLDWTWTDWKTLPHCHFWAQWLSWFSTCATGLSTATGYPTPGNWPTHLPGHFRHHQPALWAMPTSKTDDHHSLTLAHWEPFTLCSRCYLSWGCLPHSTHQTPTHPCHTQQSRHWSHSTLWSIWFCSWSTALFWRKLRWGFSIIALATLQKPYPAQDINYPNHCLRV